MLGFARRNYEPSVEHIRNEHIRKMAKGDPRSLRVLFAKRVDDAAGTVYDYVTEKLEGVQSLHGNGNFILLRYDELSGGCTSRIPPSPKELLGPAFDLGESLPGEGLRIFYNMHDRPEMGWFEVTESRLKADTKLIYGTYYLDCARLLRTIEEGSRPFEEGGARFIRNAVSEGAYYLYSGWSRTANSDDNWRLTQKSLVARIANSLNRMRRDGSGVRLSRKLGTDGMRGSGPGEFVDDTLIAGILLVLKAQEKDLHITPAIVPYGPYINGLLARNR